MHAWGSCTSCRILVLVLKFSGTDRIKEVESRYHAIAWFVLNIYIYIIEVSLDTVVYTAVLEVPCTDN